MNGNNKGVKGLSKSLYFYKPSPFHKQRCSICGIWAQDKAILKIPNDIQHKPFKKGEKVCSECYFK